ncbi:MAG: hypothetical protein AcusKO_29370 [Acuticoccus sp.]
MALPDTAKWSDLIISLGDGSTPTENFTASCLLRTDKGISFTTSSSEAPIFDCTDAAAAAWMERQGTALSATISGTGKLDLAEFDDWREWMLSMSRKNIQVEYAVSLGRNGGHFEGPFLLTSFETRGNVEDQGGLLMATIELQSASKLTWTDASS